MNKYDDILFLPHHVSATHTPMAMIDRAAQFAPFAALNGYEDAIDETARLTDSKLQLDEDYKAELDGKIALVLDELKRRPLVEVEYFVADYFKQGGAYVTKRARLKKFLTVEKALLLDDETQILLDDLLNISLLN